jgi:uncharacterized protein YbjT (DUF2867 family)
MIVVAGGTGRLGRRVVAGMTAAGLPVRVVARRPSAAADLAELGVEVVPGDVRDRAGIVAAVRGADVVVSAVQGFAGTGHVSPAGVDRDGNINLIDAARAAGADVVLMSVVGAAADSPMELFRMKSAAERYLQSAGVPATIVRATAFLELWLEILQRTAGRSQRPLVFGRGDALQNFVSVTDVAALVERVVTDLSVRGRTLEIGGPDDLTMNQLGLAVQLAAGRGGPIRHVPPGLMRLAAGPVGRINPAIGRQLRAALAMDSHNLPAPDGSARLRYPDLPETSLRALLDQAPAR